MGGWEIEERRPRPALVVAGVLVAVVGLASLVRSDPADTGTDADPAALEVDPAATPLPVASPSPRSQPPALDPQLGSWTPLPEAPLLGRDGHVAAWTGRELLVWGGASEPQDATGLHRRVLHADGAAYSPATRSWRVLAASPLPAREAAAAVWTGSELVVIGGSDHAGARSDAAAYDPATDTWRTVATPPLSPRADAAAAWAGARVVVQGGTDLLGALADGAAYDPGRDSWQPLPPAPFPVGGAGLTLTAARSGIVAGGLEIDRSGVAAAEYGLATGQWAPLPQLGEGSREVVGLVDAGDAVVGLTPRLQTACCAELVELTDDAQAWQVRSSSPLAASSASRAVWADTGYLIPPDGAAPGAYWDASTGAWSMVPGVLGFHPDGSSTTWAGDRLLMWGANDSDGPDGVELVVPGAQ